MMFLEDVPMNLADLNKVALAMVTPGKGILAADESSGTIKKRFDAIKVESTEETRRDYREMLFRSTEAMTRLCKQRFEEFNTAGQAGKIKRVLTTAEMAKRYAKGELDPKIA